MADIEFQAKRGEGATQKAMWVLAAAALAVAAAIVAVSIGGGDNTELANAPAKRSFSLDEMGRYSHFQGIEFGKLIRKTPEVGDEVSLGAESHKVLTVSLDGKMFEIELAKPIFKVFKTARVSLVDTDGGRRVAGLTFEREGESIKADRARKVVTKIASLVEEEYGIDLGDIQTAINDTYFGQRYANDFIDVRISSVVMPDSTSISFSVESRAVRAMEVVATR